MKNKKWVDVVQLYEFIKSATSEELIKLSLCSKLFRSKLIPVIYKSLKFNYSKIQKFGYKGYKITEDDSEYNDKYIQDRIEGWTLYYRAEYYGNGDSDSSDIEEIDYKVDILTNPYKPLTKKFIASREKFQSDLKLIPYQPYKLTVESVFYECYLMQDLHTKFNSLKVLDIDYIWVNFEDLQYLLNSLKYLEDLRLTNTYIFKCKPERVDSYINYPQTLKKLTFGCNKEMLVDSEYDPIPLHPIGMLPDIPKTQHLLLPTHLPNLKFIYLKPSNEEFDDKLEFLKVNSHIKKLSLYIVEEILEVFNILSKFQNLEHMDIFSINRSYSKGIEFINSPIPVPSNLKSLTIDSYYHDDIIPLLNKSFLQITNLKIALGVIYFNQLLSFISNLPAMQLLKKLKISFALVPFESNEADDLGCTPFRSDIIKFSKLYSLESVDFNLFAKYCNSAEMNLNKLKLGIDGCPKLEYIKFKSEDNLKFFGEIGSKKMGLNDNWKLISTPRRYLFHKVNQ